MKKILVKILSLSALLSLFVLVSPSSAATLSSGDLVKGPTSTAVYYVLESGKRLTFPNEATYFSWYNDFSTVKTISASELASFQLVGLITIRPGLYPVKLNSDPKVYSIAKGGILRQLENEAVASAVWGKNWKNNIVIIPAAFFTSYTIGASVGAASDYLPTNEKDAASSIANDRELPSETEAPITSSGPTSIKSLFILWDPNRPQDPAPSKDALRRIIFGTTPSVADYYTQQSNNHVKLQETAMLGWYTANKPADHYWSNEASDHNGDNFKTGAVERIAEALSKADADFDFSKYDANKDKKITPDELAIFVVIPQYGDPVDEKVTPLAANNPTDVPFSADGMTIGSVGALYLGAPVGERNKFGAIAHLYANYVFGLSDLGSSNGAFSLMSALHTDLHLDPYNRIKLGWTTPTTIAKAQEVTIQVLRAGDTGNNIIRVDRDQPLGPGLGSEYFLLENRARGSYDLDLPDEGISIWDVSGGAQSLHRLVTSTPTDDAYALWHAQPSGSIAPVGIELRWSDGVRSGVTLKNVGPASAAMQFTLEKQILTEQDVKPTPSPIR